MAERSLKLLIAGDAAGALKALGSVGDASDGIGAKFAKFGKIAAAGFAAAGVAAVAFGKSAIDAAVESQKISKVTEQLVKSTQGAAKISADEVGKLATALSNKTGIDDEAIQSAQNLILTFKNVRNEVGKGNDIFNRASALALDLSTVMGTDASGAAMQLAKALDNPTKGVTALTRSGVSFTAQQKEQIKALVESGKTLEAQKIILAEVESQVGGTAAAQATAADRAKVAFGNLQEQIGNYLLPVVEKVSNFLVTTFIPKLSELADRYGPAVGAAFQRLGEIMKPVFEWLQVNVPIIFDKVKTVVSDVITAITGFWTRHKDDIVRIVTILWDTLKGVIEGGIRVVKGIIDVFLGLFKGDWERVWNGLKDIVSGAWDGIVAIIKGFGKILWEAAKYAFDKVKDGFVAGWKLAADWALDLPEKVKGWLAGAGKWLWNAGRDIVEGLWNGIKKGWADFFVGGAGLAKKIEEKERKEAKSHSPSMLFFDVGVDIVAGLALGISSSEQLVTNAIAAINGPMAGEAARLGKTLASTFEQSITGTWGSSIYRTIDQETRTGTWGSSIYRTGTGIGTGLGNGLIGSLTEKMKKLLGLGSGLRADLTAQAKSLGYDMGAAMSTELTGTLEDVIAEMGKRIGINLGASGGADGGATGTVGSGAGGNIPKNLFGDYVGDVAWNKQWNPDGPYVHAFTIDPSTRQPIFDPNGPAPSSAEIKAVQEAIASISQEAIDYAAVSKMASGGIVTAPTLAMIGEAGPEAIVPLDRAGGFNQPPINVYVSGSVIAERDLTDTIRKALVLEQQRGKILIPTY